MAPSALAGALAAAAAVMLNVFVLNMTYDVPVKQYSFHLIFASVWIALPDCGRVWALLLGRSAAPASDLCPPYVRGRWKWVHRVAAAALFAFAFALPAGATVAAAPRPTAAEPPYVGSYTVESFRRGGKEVDPASPARWRRVSLFRTRFGAPGERGPREILVVTSGDKNDQYFSQLKAPAEDGTIVPESPRPAARRACRGGSTARLSSSAATAWRPGSSASAARTTCSSAVASAGSTSGRSTADGRRAGVTAPASRRRRGTSLPRPA